MQLLEGIKIMLSELQNGIFEVWDSLDVSGLSLSLTGLVPLILLAQEEVLVSQFWTFLLILAVITICFYLCFRSCKLTVLSVIANLIPLIIAAGFMGLFGFSINAINIFVAAVIIGVIVDDTIHLLFCYVDSE